MSVINTHTAAPGARPLSQTQEMPGRSMNRLSSGAKPAPPSGDAADAGVSRTRDAVETASARLALAGRTLRVENENLSAALPRIRDLDAAQESTRLAKHIMLAQSGAAMSAQANHSPQSVLRLLQN